MLKQDIKHQTQEEEILKDKAIKVYKEYADSQANFQFPKVNIQLEEEQDRVCVYMDVHEQNGKGLHFVSIKEQDAKTIYDHLDSQPLVRAKFGDGSVRTQEQSQKRVEDLAKRFKLKNVENQPVKPNL